MEALATGSEPSAMPISIVAVHRLNCSNSVLPYLVGRVIEEPFLISVYSFGSLLVTYNMIRALWAQKRWVLLSKLPTYLASMHCQE